MITVFIVVDAARLPKKSALKATVGPLSATPGSASMGLHVEHGPANVLGDPHGLPVDGLGPDSVDHLAHPHRRSCFARAARSERRACDAALERFNAMPEDGCRWTADALAALARQTCASGFEIMPNTSSAVPGRHGEGEWTERKRSAMPTPPVPINGGQKRWEKTDSLPDKYLHNR